MSKDSGCLVETKSGKRGRTYYRDKLVNKKVIVYVEVEGKDEPLKMLCDPKTVTVIGYVD